MDDFFFRFTYDTCFVDLLDGTFYVHGLLIDSQSRLNQKANRGQKGFDFSRRVTETDVQTE